MTNLFVVIFITHLFDVHDYYTYMYISLMFSTLLEEMCVKKVIYIYMVIIL